MTLGTETGRNRKLPSKVNIIQKGKKLLTEHLCAGIMLTTYIIFINLGQGFILTPISQIKKTLQLKWTVPKVLKLVPNEFQIQMSYSSLFI